MSSSLPSGSGVQICNFQIDYVHVYLTKSSIIYPFTEKNLNAQRNVESRETTRVIRQK